MDQKKLFELSDNSSYTTSKYGVYYIEILGRKIQFSHEQKLSKPKSEDFSQKFCLYFSPWESFQVPYLGRNKMNRFQ